MLTFSQYLEEVTIKLGSKGNDERRKRAAAFVDDLHKSSTEHFSNHRARVIGKAHVHISGDSDGVHIHDIQSHEPGSGAGTHALKHLTKLADKHKVKLHLHAKGYGDTSTHQLKKWYKKHGFHSSEDDPSDMTRHPE